MKAPRDTARDAEALGASAIGVEVDVTDTAAVEAALATTKAALGSVGGLVHAAGMVAPALEGPIDVDTWDTVLGVNVRAEAMLVSVLLPTLLEANPGSAIVGISSIEGLIGHGFIPSYVASKHALIGLTRSLAHRLGPDGIRANAVCPGYIDTPMLAPTIATPEVRAGFVRKVPLNRLGEPEDIARAVRFLHVRRGVVRQRLRHRGRRRRHRGRGPGLVRWRRDVSPRLPKPSLDGVLNLVDVDALLEHIDLNRQLERVDLNTLLGRLDMNQLLDNVDIDRLIQKVDIDALIQRVDVNQLVSRVDLEELVQRTEIGALIAESTSGVAQRVLDSLRSQAVGIDGFSNRVVNRVFRRDPAKLQAGPPRYVP